MNWFFRGAAFALWLFATGITILLLKEYTEGAGILYFCFMCVAVAAAAFGLVFARDTARHGNWVSAIFGVTAWVFGVSVIAMMEVGYWQAKQEVVREAHKTETLASSGRFQLAEQAQTQFETYKNKRSPDEVTAERNSLLRQPMATNGDTLGKITKDCTSARIQGRLAESCGKVAALDLELAQARQAEKLKGRIWEGATGVSFGIRTLDINAQAVTLARLTGMTETAARDSLIGFLVALFFICRDGMLFITTAPLKKNILPASKVEAKKPGMPTIEIKEIPAEPIQALSAGPLILNEKSIEDHSGKAPKPQDAIEALKQTALNASRNPMDAIEDSIGEVRASDDDSFTLDEIMNVLKPLCAARSVPVPDRRIVGRKLAKDGYEVQSPKRYSKSAKRHAMACKPGRIKDVTLSAGAIA